MQDYNSRPKQTKKSKNTQFPGFLSTAWVQTPIHGVRENCSLLPSIAQHSLARPKFNRVGISAWNSPVALRYILIKSQSHRKRGWERHQATTEVYSFIYLYMMHHFLSHFHKSHKFGDFTVPHTTGFITCVLTTRELSLVPNSYLEWVTGIPEVSSLCK